MQEKGSFSPNAAQYRLLAGTGSAARAWGAVRECRSLIGVTSCRHAGVAEPHGWIRVNPVAGREPVHLVGHSVRDRPAPIDTGAITQEVADEPWANWRVPNDEKSPDPVGASIIADPFVSDVPLTIQQGGVRIAYF